MEVTEKLKNFVFISKNILKEIPIKISKPKEKKDALKEKRIYFLPTGALVPNPNQTRRSISHANLCRLGDSIQKYGMIHPIIIRKRDNIPFVEMDGEKICAEEYEIVSGERRWRAAMMAGMTTVPCILTDADAKTSLEIHLTENLSREKLHFLEEAEGAKKLIRNFNQSGQYAAEILSIPKGALANRLNILSFQEDEKIKLINSELSERHAVAISKIDSKEKRLSLMEQAASASMNAPETERAVEELLHPTYRTKGDEKRKITVISDIGFFLNSLNRSINILENAGLKVYKSELNSEDYLELNIKIKKKSVLK